MPDTVTIDCIALNQILKDADQIPDGKKLEEGSNTRLAPVPPDTNFKVRFNLTNE
jgi:hypothetical protein